MLPVWLYHADDTGVVSGRVRSGKCTDILINTPREDLRLTRLCVIYS